MSFVFREGVVFSEWPLSSPIKFPNFSPTFTGSSNCLWTHSITTHVEYYSCIVKRIMVTFCCIISGVKSRYMIRLDYYTSNKDTFSGLPTLPTKNRAIVWSKNSEK